MTIDNAISKVSLVRLVEFAEEMRMMELTRDGLSMAQSVSLLDSEVRVLLRELFRPEPSKRARRAKGNGAIRATETANVSVPLASQQMTAGVGEFELPVPDFQIPDLRL